MPVANTEPPVDPLYQLTKPPVLGVALSVTTPVPHLVAPSVETIDGVVTIVCVPVAAAEPLIVPDDMVMFEVVSALIVMV